MILLIIVRQSRRQEIDLWSIFLVLGNSCSILKVLCASTIKSILFNNWHYYFTAHCNISEKEADSFDDYIWSCVTCVFIFRGFVCFYY